MTFSDMVNATREAGRYDTRAEAERITRIVLSSLGGHLHGQTRDELVRLLPHEAAELIADQVPVTRPLRASEFVDSVAARIEGASSDTARWDVSSVLSVLADAAGDELTDRIIDQLPPGYALLFGRAELSPEVVTP